MKDKLTVIMLLLCLCTGMAACGSSSASEDTQSQEENTEEVEAKEAPETSKTESTEEESAEQTAFSQEEDTAFSSSGDTDAIEDAAEETTEEGAGSSSSETAESSADTAETGISSDPDSAMAEEALLKRNETIYFTVDGTNIYLDETLDELLDTGLAFTFHDTSTDTDIPVDEAFCETPWKRGTITITVTDSSGNPVSVSLWNRWLDDEPQTYGELNVMNIGIAEPAPVAWSQASTGPYGIYIGMPSDDLLAAAGKPESNTEFVKSPTWLYSGDNYSMTVSVSDGVVKGIWIDDTNKVRHSD